VNYALKTTDPSPTRKHKWELEYAGGNVSYFQKIRLLGSGNKPLGRADERPLPTIDTAF